MFNAVTSNGKNCTKTKYITNIIKCEIATIFAKPYACNLTNICWENPKIKTPIINTIKVLHKSPNSVNPGNSNTVIYFPKTTKNNTTKIAKLINRFFARFLVFKSSSLPFKKGNILFAIIDVTLIPFWVMSLTDEYMLKVEVLPFESSKNLSKYDTKEPKIVDNPVHCEYFIKIETPRYLAIDAFFKPNLLTKYVISRKNTVIRTSV